MKTRLLDNIGITINVSEITEQALYVKQWRKIHKAPWFVRIFRRVFMPKWTRENAELLQKLYNDSMVAFMQAVIDKYEGFIVK